MKSPLFGSVFPFASVLLAIKATTLPELSEAIASNISPLTMLGSNVFASGVPMVSVEKHKLADFEAETVPVTLKAESVLKVTDTFALGPPLEFSNEPTYVPLTAGNNVAVNWPESFFMHASVELNDPEN